MLIKTFDKRLFLLLSFAFVIAAIVGTLSHELGHYIVAKNLGYNASVHYAYTLRGNAAITDSIDTISSKYGKEINHGEPFLQKERYDRLIHQHLNERFWITCGGPIQTILTGTIGLFLLFFFRKHFKGTQNLRLWQWLLIFITLFWLRQITNMVMWLWDYFFSNRFSRLDEANIARYLDLPSWSLTIITGLIGTIVLYIVLLFIPKKQRLTFICAGAVGGVAGFITWLMKLGPAVLP